MIMLMTHPELKWKDVCHSCTYNSWRDTAGFVPYFLWQITSSEPHSWKWTNVRQTPAEPDCLCRNKSSGLFLKTGALFFFFFFPCILNSLVSASTSCLMWNSWHSFSVSRLRQRRYRRRWSHGVSSQHVINTSCHWRAPDNNWPEISSHRLTASSSLTMSESARRLGAAVNVSSWLAGLYSGVTVQPAASHTCFKRLRKDAI